MQKSKVFLAFPENYTYLCPKKTKRNGTMEKDNYQLPPVWDVITHLTQLLGKTEPVRKRLSEASSILRRQIYENGPAEWLKGQSPRCKKEGRISSDEHHLREVRDAIETLSENTHLLQELENAGWDYENFYKKYDHE